MDDDLHNPSYHAKVQPRAIYKLLTNLQHEERGTERDSNQLIHNSPFSTASFMLALLGIEIWRNCLRKPPDRQVTPQDTVV